MGAIPYDRCTVLLDAIALWVTEPLTDGWELGCRVVYTGH